MKRIAKHIVVLPALVLASISGFAQFQPGVPQSQTQSQPKASALDDDQEFKNLSPEAQAWVTATMSRLHDAVQRGDANAIDQIRLDLAKRQLLGTKPCGHIVDQATSVDARVSNASKEEAISISWAQNYLTPTVRSAIFTGRLRCVIIDGDTVDGKLIKRALPNSLAVSNQHAMTAWEGEYWNSPSERTGTAHRGLFIENRFVAELNPQKASQTPTDDPDFRWNTEPETLNIKPGVMLPAAQPKPILQPCAAPKKPTALDRLKRHLENTLENQAARADADIAKNTKGGVDSGIRDTTTAAVNEAEQPEPCRTK